MAVPLQHATPGSPRLQAMANRRLRIGAHEIDLGTLRILTLPDAQRLTPKSAAVLLELACHAGQTVSRNDLLDSVWAGTCPTPDVLTQAITDLRRVLGDVTHAPRYIETVPKIGYRLVAEVAFREAGAVDVATAERIETSAGAQPARGRPGRRVIGSLLAVGALAMLGMLVWRATSTVPSSIRTAPSGSARRRYAPPRSCHDASRRGS